MNGSRRAISRKRWEALILIHAPHIPIRPRGDMPRYPTISRSMMA